MNLGHKPQLFRGRSAPTGEVRVASEYRGTTQGKTQSFLHLVSLALPWEGQALSSSKQVPIATVTTSSQFPPLSSPLKPRILTTWRSPQWAACFVRSTRVITTDLWSSQSKSSSSSQSDPCRNGWFLPGPLSALCIPPSRHLVLLQLGAGPGCRPPPGAATGTHT